MNHVFEKNMEALREWLSRQENKKEAWEEVADGLNIKAFGVLDELLVMGFCGLFFGPLLAVAVGGLVSFLNIRGLELSMGWSLLSAFGVGFLGSQGLALRKKKYAKQEWQRKMDAWKEESWSLWMEGLSSKEAYWVKQEWGKERPSSWKSVLNFLERSTELGLTQEIEQVKTECNQCGYVKEGTLSKGWEAVRVEVKKQQLALEKKVRSEKEIEKEVLSMLGVSYGEQGPSHLDMAKKELLARQRGEQRVVQEKGG